MKRKAIWTIWLIIILLALLAISLYQVQNAQARMPEEPECVEMMARRHANFDSVFRYFPERESLSLHHIATTCDEIGIYYVLWLNGHKFDVVVSDCQNRSQPPTGYPPLDIDLNTWRMANAPNAPTPAILCSIP